MGKQHHLSKRKGYDQLVSAILQKTEKHKEIEFVNFSKDKLELLANALRETGLAPNITVEDLEKPYENPQFKTISGEANVNYHFVWEPQNQKYSEIKISQGYIGGINGTYYETEDVLAEIQAQLFAEDVNNIKSNIWYRGI
jgi:hypothetical protein